MAVQQEIKSQLAKLLATEDLVVEHKNVSTAQFEVHTRVLTLPMWERASGVVYDMLVGHEVGHALYTPDEWDWRDEIPQQFMNVVEDVRIEKLMKRKYPGLRKSFAGGYAELNALDFFEIQDENLAEFSLIDRINLYYKVGAAAMIPFEDDEKVFVTRAETTETFEDVLSLAEDIHTFIEGKKKAEQEQLQNQQPSSPDGDGKLEVPTAGDGEDGEGEEIDEEYQTPSSSPSDDPAQLDTPSFSEGGGEHHEEGSTQEKFDRKTRDLTQPSHNGREITYVEIPDKVDLDKFVVDWKVVHDWIDENAGEQEPPEDPEYRWMAYYEDVDREYQEFRNDNKKEVNYLVKEFEMKKSADAYARSSTARTGVLDTKNLHTYKYNDDLFKRINIVPDGKNHGMIFVLDWSGSMQYEILATVKQLLNLTAFCKKVQIPFEVYAFTNEWQIAERAIKSGEPIEHYYGWYGNSRDDRNLVRNEIHLNEGGFHLVNFVSSRSNPKDYERQCRNFFREAYSFCNKTSYQYTPGLSLSGTPLNEAIVLLNYIIPQFKKQNDLHKVNTCILTDGEANSISYGCLVERIDREDYISARSLDYGYVQLRDRKTGRVYSKMDGWNTCTATFIEQLRDRNPGVNVIGFRILPAKRLSEFVARFADYSHYEEVQKQWRKEKSAILPFPKGYTALYAISSKDLEDDNEFEVQEDATKAQITRAFKKMLKSKSTNKKLLNSFVSHIA